MVQFVDTTGWNNGFLADDNKPFFQPVVFKFHNAISWQQMPVS